MVPRSTQQQNFSSAKQISVVIPTFQRPDQLVTAIKSVTSQTLQPVEILISDNDPDESVRQVCRDLGIPLVVYLNSSNIKGASHARNAGASIARGEWLAFLDDDDRWLPEYLEQAIETGTAGAADLILTPTVRDYSGVLEPGKQPTEGIGFDDLLRYGNFGIVGSNIVVKTETFRDLGGFDEIMPASEDIDLLVRLIQAGLSYNVTPRELVIQAVHEDGRLSDYGSIPMYLGAKKLREKYGGMVDEASRRKLSGRVHSRGYFAELNFRRKMFHLVASTRYGNYAPAGDVVRLLKRMFLPKR